VPALAHPRARPDPHCSPRPIIAARTTALARSSSRHARRKLSATLLTRRFNASSTDDRDEALKVLLQNLLDSPLIAFMWGLGRCWLVHLD
jgi:hypothetical protein